jgi:hypothetical protein
MDNKRGFFKIIYAIGRDVTKIKVEPDLLESEQLLENAQKNIKKQVVGV